MRKVFVVDTDKKPLDPVHPGRARLLLSEGRAAVYRHQPFTIILKHTVKAPKTGTYRIKIDPGSRITGLAILNTDANEVVWAGELKHRGTLIRKSLDARRALRRGRRNRKTRYRQARFANRRRSEGWLAPSLMSRVDNITTWVRRLRALCPISAISMELVRFDMQMMENPEISGIEYQQGELQGYEVREYLLEKWQRSCVYCGQADVPLQVEHIIPRIRGGSDRVSNLTLACQRCNLNKGSQTAAEFGFPDVQAQVRKPLKDAAAVNATRWRLWQELNSTGLPVECGSGGRTKYNRTRLGLHKSHWADAVSVGASTPTELTGTESMPLVIVAMGHGTRQMCQTDKYGFPIRHRQRAKQFAGFRTGDLVRADIPSGVYAGREFGRVTIRQRPSFTLNGHHVHPKYLRRLQSADGYTYSDDKSVT